MRNDRRSKQRGERRPDNRCGGIIAMNLNQTSAAVSPLSTHIPASISCINTARPSLRVGYLHEQMKFMNVPLHTYRPNVKVSKCKSIVYEPLNHVQSYHEKSGCKRGNRTKPKLKLPNCPPWDLSLVWNILFYSLSTVYL